MLSFENKPVKDWTLLEAKKYCKAKKNSKCSYSSNEEVSEFCKLNRYGACFTEPCDMFFDSSDSLPQFTPDEIAFCRLIKKTHPWANYIARSWTGIFYSEHNPLLANNAYFSIHNDFFPQIPMSTCYAIDDIINQGEYNK